MSDKRKETFVKSTRKRRESLECKGKKRLDTYVDNETIEIIDDIKKQKKLSTRGDVLDSFFQKSNK